MSPTTQDCGCPMIAPSPWLLLVIIIFVWLLSVVLFAVWNLTEGRDR